MMKFIYQDSKYSPKVEVTIQNDATLSEVLVAFEHFLKAATYVFDGELDIVDEEKGK